MLSEKKAQKQLMNLANVTLSNTGRGGMLCVNFYKPHKGHNRDATVT